MMLYDPQRNPDVLSTNAHRIEWEKLVSFPKTNAIRFTSDLSMARAG